MEMWTVIWVFSKSAITNAVIDLNERLNKAAEDLDLVKNTSS